MDVVLWTAFAVVLLLWNVIEHEMAHARALRDLGFEPAEIGLGLPMRPRWVVHRNDRASLSLSPWLVAAYVRPRDEDVPAIEARPFREAAWFAGAGVVSNLMVAGLLFAIICAIRGSWDWCAVSMAVTVLLYVFRRFYCAYLLLPTGLLGVWVVIDSIGKGELAGPVGIARYLTVNSFDHAITVGFVLALSLALINTMPFSPFDGGRVVEAALRSRFGEVVARRYAMGSTLVAVSVVAVALFADIRSLIS